MAISPREPATQAPDAERDADVLLGANGIAILRRTTALVAAAGLAVTLNNVGAGDLGWINFAGLVVCAMGGLAHGMLARGLFFPAVRMLIWGVGLTIVGISFVVAGARTPALIFMPVLCMAAAWLLSLRSAIALGAITLAAIGFFALAEHWGYTPPDLPRNTQSHALIFLFSFVGAAIVALGSTRGFQSQLQRTLDLSEDLRHQVEELRHSEERFSALFRANPVPSSTNDRDGRIIDVNDAWVAVYGIAAQDAIGKTVREVGIWNDAEERRRVNGEMLRRGRVDGAPVTLRTAGGACKPFLLYIAPVEFGGQQRLVSSILDQSDRQAAEAAQRAVNEALEHRVAERTAELTRTVETLKATQTELVEAEKLASLGAMVAGISHELNTPLGIAVTVSSTLKTRAAEIQQLIAHDQLRRSSLSEFLLQLDEMAGLVLRSTQRAAELVRGFKEVAEDRASERRRPFDLRVLVQDIVHAARAACDKPCIDITQDVPADISCDGLPGPVGQVLANLLQNALRHAFADRATGTIAITASLQGGGDAAHQVGQVVLRVTDDGVGMSEHVQRHAFDPFFTTHMGQGGSGLGLAVSHRLATSTLGGSLSLESAPGAGCRFTFCFPRTLPP